MHKLGAMFGAIVGAVEGFLTAPKTELDERDKRVRAGKATLKARRAKKLRS